MILVVWLLTLATAVLRMRQRLSDPTFAWGLRLGVLLGVPGMAIAVPMTPPSRAQIESSRASGQQLTVAGAHTIGAPDGGPGLPVVGWSTRAGDLRPAHFLGLHGLQVLPLAGWLISRRRRLGSGHQLALVWTSGALHGGLVLLLGWQALRGQPLLAPDALTLAALFALFGAAAISVGAILWNAIGVNRAGSVAA